jgi:hypothetical protein
VIRRSFTMLVALVAVALASLISLAPAQAAGNAKVYVVHGIPGRDLGLQPSLPVDVSVNGACALTRFKYTDTVGPIELPAGSYNVTVCRWRECNDCRASDRKWRSDSIEVQE